MSDFGTYLGYRRENGAAGCRNHVLVLPVDDLSNAAVEAVANHVEGTLAIPHPYGRLQFGPDLELHFRLMVTKTGAVDGARSSGSARTPTSPRWS